MKYSKTALFAIIIVSVLFLQSCNTSQEVVISGTPNTTIYKPDKTVIGTIPADGQLKVKLPDKDYYALLLSKRTEDDTYIPFLLDYKKCSRAGNDAAFGISFLIPPYIGFCCYGWVFLGRSWQAAYEYEYKYTKNQQTNSDMLFSQPQLEYVDFPANRQFIGRPSQNLTEQAESESGSYGTQRASRKLGDLARKVQGTYTVSGGIYQQSEIVEQLHNASIIIKRIDSDEVSINIVESNGNDFFGRTLKCKVKATEQRKLTLSSQEIPNIAITIDDQGNISYNNPSVEIDHSIYTLSLKGKR